MYRLIVITIAVLSSAGADAQERNSAKTSEVVITYDKDTYASTDSKALPFDKRFTLQILKFPAPGIKQVEAFECEFKNGSRTLKQDGKGKSVGDLQLDFKSIKDTLNVFFPQLKPGKEFDIAIIKQLTGDNLALAYKLNEALYNNDPKANAVFLDLFRGARDKVFLRSYFSYVNIAAYQAFFVKKLFPLYTDLHTPANLHRELFPAYTELQMLQTGLVSKNISFSDNDRLIKILSDAATVDILEGTKTIRYDHATEKTKGSDYSSRMNNINASVVFFDSLSRKINYLLSEGYDPGGAVTALMSKITRLTDALVFNRDYIKEKFEQINKEIEDNNSLRENEWLIGSTEAKDIKTKGGNLFTLDAGFVNIVTKDISNEYVYMPKLYSGLNIYFRPIDKNSRKKNFPKNYPADPENGPDYNIAAVNSIWQHLSLTVGLTFGAMGNSQFDVLYNNAALMIGPGYRVGRFFKINGGMVLLKRNSKNPLISEKKVIGGSFMSVSMDIDIVQGIKDFTSMIFK